MCGGVGILLRCSAGVGGRGLDGNTVPGIPGEGGPRNKYVGGGGHRRFVSPLSNVPGLFSCLDSLSHIICLVTVLFNIVWCIAFVRSMMYGRWKSEPQGGIEMPMVDPDRRVLL